MLELVQKLHVKARLARFHSDQDGLTIVEYAVAGALIAAALVLAFTALGDGVEDVICEITGAIGGAC